MHIPIGSGGIGNPDTIKARDRLFTPDVMAIYHIVAGIAINKNNRNYGNAHGSTIGSGRGVKIRPTAAPSGLRQFGECHAAPASADPEEPHAGQDRTAGSGAGDRAVGLGPGLGVAGAEAARPVDLARRGAPRLAGPRCPRPQVECISLNLILRSLSVVGSEPGAGRGCHPESG
jgi:hypothetical protein